MGEWFIEQKARRSRLAESKALKDIMASGLFDQKQEDRLTLFRAAITDSSFAPKPGDFLVLYTLPPNELVLHQGVKPVAIVEDADKENLNDCLSPAAISKGLFTIRIYATNPIENTFLFVLM